MVLKSMTIVVENTRQSINLAGAKFDQFVPTGKERVLSDYLVNFMAILLAGHYYCFEPKYKVTSKIG